MKQLPSVNALVLESTPAAKLRTDDLQRKWLDWKTSCTSTRGRPSGFTRAGGTTTQTHVTVLKIPTFSYIRACNVLACLCGLWPVLLWSCSILLLLLPSRVSALHSLWTVGLEFLLATQHPQSRLWHKLPA
jgi:hypothetical protein